MRKRTDHDHLEGDLMGSEVEHEGETYTVVGLQNGTAVISLPDGFRRHKPIYEINEQKGRWPFGR
ncbi:hypothetical protein ACFWY6_04490 [Streptomyces sp. NPDC059037]|uniref:hypothetical protein n=1 Tax=Streptomyces sp. NPDC059037 TaxID=3346710 RepID=UPI00367B6F0D